MSCDVVMLMSVYIIYEGLREKWWERGKVDM